jgi:SAM-dependent methyltransferase
MNEVVSTREAMLATLSGNKRRISVLAEEVHRIDATLRERWGIDFLRTELSLEDYLRQLPDSGARTQGLKVFERARAANSSSLGERLMYEAMADLELCGIVTSTRRAFLIDSVSLSCGLYRTLGLTGAVLDVGCHVGVVPDLMAITLGTPVVGIEPVAAAVSAGTSVLRDREDVKLIHARIPWETESKFDLLTSVDCMPADAGDRALFLKGVGAVLREGGIAVVTSAHWIDSTGSVLRRQLEFAGLGFGFADVVGGFGDMPTRFSTEGTAVLIKGGRRPFPRNFKTEAENEWDWFRDYANETDTPWREKTQAFMRAACLGEVALMLPSGDADPMAKGRHPRGSPREGLNKSSEM